MAAISSQTSDTSGNTVRLHRVLRAPADRVYRAFLDPDAMSKWLPPHGFTGKVHHMDARVGGGYRMSFTNFGTGKSHSFGGTYVELTPHERIRYTDKFEDPAMPGEMHRMDAKVGGGHRMSFTNFGTGETHSFGGTYVELKPHERIRYTDKFDDPNLPGEMKVTVDLRKVESGTDLSIVQEGIPAAIPLELCYLGWQESLSLLALLVEPSIP